MAWKSEWGLRIEFVGKKLKALQERRSDEAIYGAGEEEFWERGDTVLCNSIFNGLKKYLENTHIKFQDFGGLVFINYGCLTMLTRIHLDKSTCSVHLLSPVQLCNPMDCSTPGFPVHPTPWACSNSCSSSWTPKICPNCYIPAKLVTYLLKYVSWTFWDMVLFNLLLSFPGGSDSKVSACNVGDLGSIPGLGRSSGEWNGSPLQYSCLENSIDGGAW